MYGQSHTQVKKDPRQLSEKGVLSTACFAFTLLPCVLSTANQSAAIKKLILVSHFERMWLCY